MATGKLRRHRCASRHFRPRGELLEDRSLLATIAVTTFADVVDPEDWSPQRAQYIDSLGPNQSTTLSWEVNAILDGEFMVYLVAIPHPESAESSSQVVASPGLHLSVAKFASLNPSGILPFVIGVPVVLLIAIFLLFRLRRRQIDAGGSD